MKVGSIVGLVGGISFIALIAWLLAMPSESSEATDITVNISSGMSALAYLLATASIVVATIVFAIALMLGGRMGRGSAIAASTVALALSLIGFVGMVIYFNVLMICFGWMFLWEPMLELIGAILMLSNALKYEK